MQPRDGERFADRTNPGASSTGLDELQVARALWFLQEYAAPLAINAATRSLLEGIDGDSLRELAGERPDMNTFELGALIDRAITSAGGSVEELTRESALYICAVHYAKQVLAGTLGVRELARWAHQQIGHEGPGWSEELVLLDDAFDEYADFGGSWATEPDWRQVIGELLSAPPPPATPG
ncbi:hypothetical protein [Microcella humidisoli]|uniref:DUF4240 domain-containing protein n=1 Tax=Microcella humidisoli TaxID=2963406 RepID=A0ABY5FWC3_9MICO|nr:hypothetical protein [Microcella humidisoli]UTT62437.1 hypothetical protein NNL39_12400 [Microcella humidisoli]